MCRPEMFLLSNRDLPDAIYRIERRRRLLVWTLRTPRSGIEVIEASGSPAPAQLPWFCSKA